MQQNDKKKDGQSPAEKSRTINGLPSDKMSPGDQAPPGTPGTGENICPVCSGEGTVDGQKCVNCGGTGMVIEGISGA